jgi:hypothetical protein
MAATSQFRTFFAFASATKNIRIKTCNPVTVPVILYGCETWAVTIMKILNDIWQQDALESIWA